MYKYLFLAIISLFANVFAQTVNNQQKFFSEIFNDVQIERYNEQPNWKFKITALNHEESQWFFGPNENLIQTNEFIKLDSSLYFFVSISEGDFNPEHSVTAIYESINPPYNNNPECVFLLSANISSNKLDSNMNGAACNYVDGIGYNILKLDLIN